MGQGPLKPSGSIRYLWLCFHGFQCFTTRYLCCFSWFKMFQDKLRYLCFFHGSQCFKIHLKIVLPAQSAVDMYFSRASCMNGLVLIVFLIILCIPLNNFSSYMFFETWNVLSLLSSRQGTLIDTTQIIYENIANQGFQDEQIIYWLVVWNIFSVP